MGPHKKIEREIAGNKPRKVKKNAEVSHRSTNIKILFDYVIEQKIIYGRLYL